GGVFTNQVGAIFTVQNDATVNFGGGSPRFDNAGTFIKALGAQTAFNNVPFNNAGFVDVQSGTLAFTRDYTQSSRITRLHDTTVKSGMSININAGRLEGSGTVDGKLVNGGQVSPGLSPGQISVTNTYAQSGPGAYNVVIGGATAGTQLDTLAITGASSLA